MAKPLSVAKQSTPVAAPVVAAPTLSLSAPKAASTSKTMRQVTLSNGHVLTLKQTEKGGMSVYGLGRFPVTLYRNGWAMLNDQWAQIAAAAATLPEKAEE